MTGTSDFERFVEAQDEVMDQVLRELSVGRKASHWMWFVFPQLAGLGHSAMAARYALASLEEARAYVRHPLLGPRLIACTGLVNRVVGRSAREILGTPDDMKFRSSMTLFAAAAPTIEEFQDALEKYFGGEVDRRTMEKLPPTE